jgi:hypothetical protein
MLINPLRNQLSQAEIAVIIPGIDRYPEVRLAELSKGFGTQRFVLPKDRNMRRRFVRIEK